MDSLRCKEKRIHMCMCYASHITETMMEQKQNDSKFVRQNLILKMAELREGKQIVEGMGNEK